MAITTNTYTGWSDALAYNISSGNPISDSSYTTLSGNIFQRTWFDSYRLARKFKNVSSMYQQISKLVIEGHPCHANNQIFGWSTGGTVQMASEGEGCTLAVDIYLPNGESYAGITKTKLEPISRYNCYYMGYGNVSTQDEKTSFGSTTFFGPGMIEPNSAIRADVDSAGIPRYRHELTFEFNNAPVLAQGESMYLHIRPTDWTGTTDTCLVGLYTMGSYFTPIMHEVDAYIWIYTSSGWVKSKVCYKYTANGWLKLGD